MSEKGKHTPGPWEAHKTHYGDDRTWDVSSPLRTVATINDGDGLAEANARLIAAAPELLEALEILVAPDDGKIRVDEIKSNFAKGKAAIRKARGEESGNE